MYCTDVLLAALYLVRYVLFLLAGAALPDVWQAVRSVAVRCSSGPLG